MTKLSFDYQDRSGEYVAEYRGIRIRAVTDTDAANPWDDGDFNPPLITVSGDRNGGLDLKHADGADSPLFGMSRHWISRNWQAIAKALDLDTADHDKEAKQSRKDYGGRLGDIRKDMFEDRLSEIVPDRYGNAGDYLSALAALWTLRGVQSKEFTSTGYSQGDYADCLLVATPDWLAKIGNGADYDAGPQLDAMADIWGAWAWGNCYGYIAEIVSEDDEGEESRHELDSCWGYYGNDHEESGLAESAMNAIDCHLDAMAKARLACLKTLIRNRVPLALRPALLESVTC